MVTGDAKPRTEEERLSLVQPWQEKALGGTSNSILPITTGKLLSRQSQALQGGVW